MHLLKWSAYYLFLLIIIALLTFNIINKEYGLNSFVFWLISILLLLFPLLVKYFQNRKKYRKQPFQLKSFFFSEIELLFVALICVLPGLIALQTPEKLFFHGDEAIISRNAEEAVKKSLKTREWNFLGHEDGTISRFPALWYVMQGFIITSFGPSVASVKTFSLFAHLGIVITQFILLSKFFNKYLSWAWVIFYSSMPLVIHFSITGYQNLQSTFFAVLSVALALFAVSTSNKAKKNLLLTTSGVVGGIGMYFYLSSLLIPAYVLLITFTYKVIHKSKIRALVKDVAIFLFPYLIVSLPYWIVSAFDYNFIGGRSSALSPFSHIVSFAEFKSVLLVQLTQTLRPFFTGGFNGEGLHYTNLPAFSQPLLAIFTILGIFGLVVYKNYYKNIQKVILISYILIICTTLFFGSIVTSTPPAVQRILTIFPYLTFFSVLGVWYIIKPTDNLFNRHPSSSILIILVTTLSLIQIRTFFIQHEASTAQMNMNNQSIQEFIHFYETNQYQGTNSILLTQIPIHRNDQIYYYSQGKIRPEPIDLVTYDLSTMRNKSRIIYLLVDDKTLERTDLSHQRIMIDINYQHKIWFMADQHLFLIQ